LELELSDFDFQLPQELIAQEPFRPADSCGLMILNRQEKTISEKRFFDLVDYFSTGDVLVLNDTKVIPARLFARRLNRPQEKPIEIFLLKNVAGNSWLVLGRPAKKLLVGEEIVFEGKFTAVVSRRLKGASRIVEFPPELEVLRLAENYGEMPLPPYIKKYPYSKNNLKNDYQTFFARVPGATAAPTAGLHFTPKLLQTIADKKVKIIYITLHTGLGTFQPIRPARVSEHQMAAEFCEVSAEAATTINQAKEKKHRIFAVGTTVVRALESAADLHLQEVRPFIGETDLFIYPGFNFRVVDALITNFHLPRSTLILLASAFAGVEFLKEAYALARQKKYRFFSFGDAMLIL